MIFKELVAGEKTMFSIDACETLVFTVDCKWLDTTLLLVFDCGWITSINGGQVALRIYDSLLVRNLITLDMERRSATEPCVQRRVISTTWSTLSL